MVQTRSSTPKKGGTKHFEELPADGKPKRGSKAGASGGTKASPSPANAVPPSSTADFHWEFGGPIGGLGIMVGLPTVMYFLLFSCGSLKKEGASYCVSGPLALPELTELDIPPLHEWWSLEAAAVFLGWFAFQVALERLLPGDVAEGVKLKTGERLKYRLNGHLSFWISFVVLGYGRPTFDGEGGVTMGMFQLSWLYDHYLQLLTASVAFSFALSAYLYATSFGTGKLLADGGVSGNALYDFFIGRQLNPRVSSFDLKCFCELRPGLIGWAVINLACAAKQFEVHGSLSYSMVLVNAFQGLYVWDALFQERAILTTMDITTDGFGFMLAFGDLAWVPFTYTLQARYLVHHDPKLSVPVIAAIAVLNVMGYFVFRGANGQKDAFRRDPSAPEVAHLKYMPTERGTRLLVSGYWGLARKINYTGDWCMGLSWCLLTGFNSLVPYFYAIYFGVLLVHRAIRDDGFCAAKYGADWPKYKAKVPYMFVPGLF